MRDFNQKSKCFRVIPTPYLEFFTENKRAIYRIFIALQRANLYLREIIVAHLIYKQITDLIIKRMLNGRWTDY